MKYLLLILPLFLSACMTPKVDESKSRIEALEQEITTLKMENANLKNENALLQAGGNPAPVEPISGDLSEIFPEGSTFEEVDNSACVKAAEAAFIASGNAECKKQGLTEADINAGKCTLPKEFIDSLVTAREQMLIRCNPM